MLIGGMRALNANFGQSPHGVFTDRPETLSNDFFVNLLDMGTEWQPSGSDENVYEGPRSRRAARLKWTATSVDLVFGSHSELRALAEVYACDDAEREVRARLRRRLGQGHEPRPLRPILTERSRRRITRLPRPPRRDRLQPRGPLPGPAAKSRSTTPAASRRPNWPSAPPDTASGALWCSPLLRARETADIVAAQIGLEPQADARLMETDAGDWTDRTFAEVRAEAPELFDAFAAADPGFAFPGGESFAEQEVRVERRPRGRRSGRAARARGLPRDGHPRGLRQPLAGGNVAFQRVPKRRAHTARREP